MSRVLAIDLGGTNMRAAVYAGDPSAMKLLTHDAAPANRAAFVDRLNALRAKAGDIEAIGFAVPGLVEGTTCRWIPNLPYLDGFDMRALFPDLRIGYRQRRPGRVAGRSKRRRGQGNDGCDTSVDRHRHRLGRARQWQHRCWIARRRLFVRLGVRRHG